jgi:hypothetical protein
MWWLNRLVNPAVRGLLRSPAHRLVSGSLLLLSYRGRRTGTWHTLPVQYAQDGGVLYVLPARPERKAWWRGLREPSRVRVLLRGRPLDAVAGVVDDPARLDEGVRAYLRRFPRATASLSARPEGAWAAGMAEATGGGPPILIAIRPDWSAAQREGPSDRHR